MILITWRRLVLMLVRPSAVAADLARTPPRWGGAVAVLQLGLVWAGLSAALHAAGHGPSMSLVPIPRSSYYAAQAVFVVPLTLACWWLMSVVASAVAGADAAGKAKVAAVLGHAYAAPLIFLFLAIDIVLYAGWGFAALGKYLRFYAPIAPIWAIVVGTLGLREALQISTRRALWATLAGMVAQVLVGGVLLR